VSHAEWPRPRHLGPSRRELIEPLPLLRGQAHVFLNRRFVDEEEPHGSLQEGKLRQDVANAGFGGGQFPLRLRIVAACY